MVSPVEPGPERLDIRHVDRRAAPDAEARRGVAVTGDVIGGTFGFEKRGHALDARFVGTIDREADAGFRAGRGIGGEMVEPVARLDDPVERSGIGVAAGNRAFEPSKALDPFERENGIFDRQHRGGVDRLADEDTFGELALGHQAEDLGQRPGGGVALQPLYCAGAEDQHAVRALAAEHLLPRESGDIDLVPRQIVGEHRAGRVGEAEAGAVVRDPRAVGHAYAAGGAVPGKQHVMAPVDIGEIGQLAIVGADDVRVELQLLDRVGDPALAEAFPRDGGNRAGAEHGPHRHFISAGVRAGDDADAVRAGQLEVGAHEVDAMREALLADFAAMRPAEAVSGKCGGGPARGLGARPRREERARGQAIRLGIGHVFSPRRELAPRWDGVARSRPSASRSACKRAGDSVDNFVSRNAVCDDSARFTASSSRFVPHREPKG